jgi:hypothetical protein
MSAGLNFTAAAVLSFLLAAGCATSPGGLTSQLTVDQSGRLRFVPAHAISAPDAGPVRRFGQLGCHSCAALVETEREADAVQREFLTRCARKACGRTANS